MVVFMKINKYIYKFQITEKNSETEIPDTFDGRHMETFVRVVNNFFNNY